MALYQAYYDASGSQSSPGGGLSVVGLVASEAKWLRFEEKWEQVLAEFGVAAHHMKHFTGSSPGSDFAAWAGDDAKRGRYEATLIHTIKLGINKGFAVVIAPNVLQTVNKEFRFGENGYALAANVCRRYAERWLHKKRPTAELAHVFEAGDTGQGFLRDLVTFQDVREGLHFPLVVSPKVDAKGRRLRQFEAADLIAWETRRWILDVHAKRTRPREPLLEIGKTLPLAGATLTADRIVRICKEQPDLYPPRA